MKRVYFIFSVEPIGTNWRLESRDRKRITTFSTFDVYGETIWGTLAAIVPELANLGRFNNFALSLRQSAELREQLIHWLRSNTCDRPDAKPEAICSFQIEDRHVILNLRDINDSYIYTYWKVYDMLDRCISEGKPTFVSILDDL